MAIYHCVCKNITRNSGRSAVGSSAYRSGEKIENERDGITHDYTHKSGVAYSEIMLPQNAPEEWQDRSKLWNEVERIEKSKDSELSKEYEIALPKELTQEQQIELARNIAKKFVADGRCVDIAIHDKKDGNPHAHIMTTVRPIDENGKWENKSEKLYLCKNAKGEERGYTSSELAKQENTEWKKQYHYSKNGNPKAKKVYLSEYEKESNPKYAEYERIKGDKYPKSEKFGKMKEKVEKWYSNEYLEEVRERVAKETNRSLEQYGHEERVDHRSYKEQGKEQVPTVHLGTTATQMERRGIETDRGNINREIRSQNEQIKVINAQTRELAINRINIHTDIQIQNVHSEIQNYKAIIPTATKEQLESIQKSVNNLDKKMEKVRESGAFKHQDICVDYNNRVYVPKMEYEYKRYKKSHSELTQMTEERRTELLNTINKNIQDMRTKEQQIDKPVERPKTNEDLQNFHKELSSIRKEYTEVQSQLAEHKKIVNQPRVINDYAIAYNNAERCIQEINKNQAIFNKAKEEKGKLGLLQRAEKKKCDDTMQKAQDNINKQMGTLNKLGINELAQAPQKMKEMQLNDRKEKQTITTFNQNQERLQSRAIELESRYAEMKASLPPKAQEVIGELKTEYRKQREEKLNMSEWKEQMNTNKAVQNLRAFEKSVQDKVNDKLQEQNKAREKGGRGYGE